MWWNKYIGINFAEKGRTIEGFDCWGLLKYVYNHDHPSRVILPGYEDLYNSTNDRETLGRVMFEERQDHWREVTKPQEFDAVLLRMGGVPMHVGIVTKPNHMIHCALGIGTAHERFDVMRWQNKILGFFRYE